MTDAEIFEGLTEIFADVFMRDIELTAESSAKTVAGWDSFKQIEIVLASEERWGIKFATKELETLKTVGDLARLIAAKTA